MPEVTETGTPGVKVVSFDSLEDLLAWQDENEEHANQGILPEQEEITWGDYVIRFSADSGLVIWGKIITFEEYLASETQGEPPERAAEIEDGVLQHYARGYRYGFWTSIHEPEGEWGSAHIVSLWKVTQEDYEQAVKDGWKIEEQKFRAIMEECDSAAIREGKMTVEQRDELEWQNDILNLAARLTTDLEEVALVDHTKVPLIKAANSGILAMTAAVLALDMGETEEEMMAIMAELEDNILQRKGRADPFLRSDEQ